MKLWKLAFLLIAVLLFQSCKDKSIDVQEPANNLDPDEVLSGGAATVFISGAQAFSSPAPNLSSASMDEHNKGDFQFEQKFVANPSPINGGLGPLYNNVSCFNCHTSDGRGKPPDAGESLESMLIRISIPGTDQHSGPNPVTGFGSQLQDKALFGYEPEGNVNVSYIEIPGKYPDGTTYSLRKPLIIISGRAAGGILVSPRVAPSVHGMGLLEAIPEDAILKNTDEFDTNNDGISGKPNYVWDYETGTIKLGRFGWKANQPGLLQQVASAYVEDMGITNPLFKMENCHTNTICDSSSDDPEISQEILEAVTFYVRTLGVPARRDYDKPDVLKGKELFNNIGCSSCHIPEFRTGAYLVPELSNQKIFPYTDMLLHDMGDGLADNRPDFKAGGREWKTAPLWGIGLVNVVNGHTNFLHDGRARSFEEAILWHDEEAKKSKIKFMNLYKEERDYIIKFLNSL